jgi:hypothetical protein
MKKTTTIFGMLTLFALAFVWQGCLRDSCESTTTFVRYDPIYKTAAAARAQLKVEGPRTLKKPGKLYVYGRYLFINERQEGIHVLDNSDPSNPRPIAFWNLPGNVDMAIKGQQLYADQYMDLVTFDLSNWPNPQEVCRQTNAFGLFGFTPNRGYIVDYERTETVQELPCNDPRTNNGWFQMNDAVFVNRANTQTQSGIGGGALPASTGIAGSYARFGLVNDYLYTVDRTTLKTYAATSSCLVRADSVQVGWNIETIFPWRDRLFLGSQTGVFIFNNTNPARPRQEAVFQHATGCDPVVCDENYAYVTVHSGTNCQGTINNLSIIDITQLPTARHSKTYDMKKPMGLSVTGKYLYLCDDGLKIFDKTQPLDLKLLSHLKSLKTYDVIALDATHLLVIGDGGFYQFDVSDPAKPKQISKIAANI